MTGGVLRSKVESRQRKKKRGTLNISILCDFYAKTRRQHVLEHVLHSFSQMLVGCGKEREALMVWASDSICPGAKLCRKMEPVP